MRATVQIDLADLAYMLDLPANLEIDPSSFRGEDGALSFSVEGAEKPGVLKLRYALDNDGVAFLVKVEPL